MSAYQHSPPPPPPRMCLWFQLQFLLRNSTLVCREARSMPNDFFPICWFSSKLNGFNWNRFYARLTYWLVPGFGQTSLWNPTEFVHVSWFPKMSTTFKLFPVSVPTLLSVCHIFCLWIYGKTSGGEMVNINHYSFISLITSSLFQTHFDSIRKVNIKVPIKQSEATN